MNKLFAAARQSRIQMIVADNFNAVWRGVLMEPELIAMLKRENGIVARVKVLNGPDAHGDDVVFHKLPQVLLHSAEHVAELGMAQQSAAKVRVKLERVLADRASELGHRSFLVELKESFPGIDFILVCQPQLVSMGKNAPALPDVLQGTTDVYGQCTLAKQVHVTKVTGVCTAGCAAGNVTKGTSASVVAVLAFSLVSRVCVPCLLQRSLRLSAPCMPHGTG